MTQRLARTCIIFAAVLFCSVVSAQTNFATSLSCGQVLVGPLTILADPPGAPTTGVALTPNVTATGVALLSTFLNHSVNDSTVTSGSFNGARPRMLTLGGVSVNFTREYSFVVNTASDNCSTDGIPAGCLLERRISVIVNLGAQGTVLISSPSRTVAGYTSGRSVGFVTAIPATIGVDTALLTPAAPIATPLPPSVFLILTGLAAAGLHQVRRRVGRPFLNA